MFEKTVCLYRVTDDGLGHIFTVKRGEKIIVSGMTYDSYDGMIKIVRRLARRRVKVFQMID